MSQCLDPECECNNEEEFDHDAAMFSGEGDVEEQAAISPSPDDANKDGSTYLVDLTTSEQTTLNKLFGSPIEVWCKYGGDHLYVRYFYFNVKRQRVAFFYLDQLPGCCGVGLVHDFYVPRTRDSNNVWPEMQVAIMKIVERIAKKAEYTVLMLTDNHYDQFGKDLLLQHGWEEIYGFKSRKTRAQVYMVVKKLEY